MQNENDLAIRSMALNAALSLGAADVRHLLESANEIEAYMRSGLAPKLPPKLAEAA